MRGICALTREEGEFLASHLIPKALTRPSVPGRPLIQIASGKKPVRRWDSWYDDGLVTHKGPHASNAASITFGVEHPERMDKHSITIRNWTMLGEPPAGEAPWGGPSGLVKATSTVPDIKGTKVFGVPPGRLYLDMTKGDWAPFPDAELVTLDAMPA